MNHHKLVLNSADVMGIMGVSDSTARRKLREIKEYYGKESYHHVTIDEFSARTGITHAEIYAYFGWTKK